MRCFIGRGADLRAAFAVYVRFEMYGAWRLGGDASALSGCTLSLESAENISSCIIKRLCKMHPEDIFTGRAFSKASFPLSLKGIYRIYRSVCGRELSHCSICRPINPAAHFARTCSVSPILRELSFPRKMTEPITSPSHRIGVITCGNASPESSFVILM